MQGETQTRRQRELPTVEEFNATVDLLKMSKDSFITLASLVAQAGGNAVVGEETVNQQAVRSYSSSYNRVLDELAKDYAQAMRGKRKKTRGGSGLPNLSLYTQPFRDFWNAEETILGPIDPLNPGSGQVKDYIGLLTNEGIASSTMLTSLWPTYVDANELDARNPEKRNLFRVTPSMQTYLGDAINWLSTEGNTPTASQWANHEAALVKFEERKREYQDKLRAWEAADREYRADQSLPREQRQGIKKPRKPTEPKRPAEPVAFDPEGFPKTYQQIINSMYTVSRNWANESEDRQEMKRAVGNTGEVTPEDLARMNDTGVRQEVQDTIDVLKNTREIYKSIKRQQGEGEEEE